MDGERGNRLRAPDEKHNLTHLKGKAEGLERERMRM